MTYNITRFIKEFKTLIEKEKKSNKIIKGKILQIEDDKVYVSTNYAPNLSKNIPVEINRIKAYIIDIKNKNICLRVDDISSFKSNQVISIYNIQREIIINKLQETYNDIVDNKISIENKETLEVLFDKKKVTYGESNFKIHNLNKNQEKAVIKSLQSNKFHLIQGPPGTGKTHTIIEIIKQLYSKNCKILITTHTHIALDNIIERLNNVDENKILRIGEKDKVSSKVIKYTMENHIKQNILYKEIIEKETIIQNLSKEQSKSINEINIIPHHESFFSKFLRTIFNIKNNELVDNNFESKVIDCNNVDPINELKLEIENIKKNIQSDILEDTKIFASTVLSSSSFLTKNINFDYVIMDEASQVPVYLALIPLMKTSKFILIGDNKQLQPIQNYNSSYTLNKSIFNLLIDKYPNDFTFLNIQYRMNEEISNIASNLYYNNHLLTGNAVKKQKIKLKDHKSFFLDEEAITVIDTSKIHFNESSVSGGCCNKYESEIIFNLVNNLVKNGIPMEEIGVITPYKKQKNFITKLLKKRGFNVECDTIYRFQGREKDVIIVSFCKSSRKSLTSYQKKFLADENQLNVSITRARKKLILIGNLDMIRTAKNIGVLLDEVFEENFIYLRDLL